MLNNLLITVIEDGVRLDEFVKFGQNERFIHDLDFPSLKGCDFQSMGFGSVWDRVRPGKGKYTGRTRSEQPLDKISITDMMTDVHIPRIVSRFL